MSNLPRSEGHDSQLDVALLAEADEERPAAVALAGVPPLDAGAQLRVRAEADAVPAEVPVAFGYGDDGHLVSFVFEWCRDSRRECSRKNFC